MKKKVMILGLIILLLGAACAPKPEPVDYQKQLDDQKAQLEADFQAQLKAQENKLEEDFQRRLASQEAQFERELAGLTDNLTAKEAQIIELTEEIADLEAEADFLRQPPPKKVSGEIVGHINAREASRMAKKLFTTAGGWAHTRDPQSLVSLETLKQFLAADQTDKLPERYRPDQYDAGDERAFQLKNNWIKAGLPAWSLGLAKVEADIQYYGKMLVWRNIFLARESSTFVFYLVDPCTDEITKIEGPSATIRVVLLGDFIY